MNERKQLEDELRVVVSELKLLEKQAEYADKGRLAYLADRKITIEWALRQS